MRGCRRLGLPIPPTCSGVGVQPSLRGQGRAAHRGMPDRARPRRQRDAAARPGGAAGAERGGVRQPPAPVVARLPRRRSRRQAATPRRAAVRACGGADPAHGRHARPARAASRRGAGGGGAASAGAVRRGVSRAHDDGAAPARRCGRAGDRARADLAGGRGRRAAGRGQRVLLREARDARGARRAAVHRGRTHHGGGRAAAGDAGALVQARAGDARAVRRPAGGLRQHARHRPDVRGDGRDAQTAAADVPQGAAGHDGGANPERHGGGRARAAHGRGRGRCRDARGIRGAAGVRAVGHRRYGLPRLLPDRRRFHPMGESAGHPRRPRPRLGCGPPSSPGR